MKANKMFIKRKTAKKLNDRPFPSKLYFINYKLIRPG